MLSYLRKNTKAIMLAVVVIFAFTMLYGLGYNSMKGDKKKDTSFLKVNGRDVDPMRFNNIFARLRENFPDKIKPSDLLFLQNVALSQTIDFSIMLDDAKKNVGVSPSELDSAIEQIAKQQKFNNARELKMAVERSNIPWNSFKKMLVEEMLVQKMTSKIRDNAKVEPNDLKEIRASHILIGIKPGSDGDSRSKKLAEEIRRRVDKGQDFAVLAKNYSDDPASKSKGGDLGFFGTGAMVKPFEDAAFSLKISEFAGPIKTDYGYHIIKLTDVRIKKIPGRPDIQAAILQEKQENAYRNWYFNLKQKSKVEILDPAMRALDLRFKGKISEAIVEYNKAIAENPNNAYYRIFLGLLYEDLKQLGQAISQYQEAVKIEPANPNIYVILGQAYNKNGQKVQAAEQFKKASLIAGDNKALHQELQKLFKDLKMPEFAQKEQNEVFRIEKKELFEKELIDRSSKIKTN